jgi:hypothetical protein
MNTKISAAFILAGLIAAPAFADGDLHYPDQQLPVVSQHSTVTRAQVRQELAQLRKAGYTQLGEDITYPAKIQAAEARVQAAQAQPPAESGYGGVKDQTFESGPQVSQAQQVPGLTRKQVYDKLVQAEKDGSLARLNVTVYEGS